MSTAKVISVTGILLASMVIAIGLIAQQDSAQQEAAAAPATAPALRVTTHLVLLDVIATGKDGKPITDLKKEDFKVEEGGKNQNISMFSLEQANNAAEPLQTPPGMFTNRPAYKMPDAGATILLIDGLNSPFRNQSFARYRLMQYAANQVKAGRPTAVFALGSKLIEMQSFTTDPELLRKAIEAYRPQSPTGQTTLSPVHGSADILADLGQTRGGGAAATAALHAANALQQFTSEQTTTDLQFRIDTTLNAMRDLSQMVAGQPGRKNLVWVTAGPPFSLIPSDNEQSFVNQNAGDPTVSGGTAPPLAVSPNGADSFALAISDIRQQAAPRVKRAAALLSSEQVAIYPVDVRGVVASSATDAAGSGTDSAGFLITDTAFGSQVTNGNAALEVSQNNMEDLAKETGGKVYKNRNDIENAVAEAAADGGTYYELAYAPDKAKFDGSFHKIRVSVNRPGTQLRYRPGYFAVDQNKESEKDRRNDLVLALNSPEDSSMVIFDASAQPQAGSKDLPVKILIRPDTISIQPAKDGKKQIDVDYYALTVTSEGRQMGMQGKTAKAALDNDQYASLMKQGLMLTLALPQPPPGHYDLRLAVRDNQTGYIGTIHAPIDVPK